VIVQVDDGGGRSTTKPFSRNKLPDYATVIAKKSNLSKI